jgi:hypothetical protein
LLCLNSARPRSARLARLDGPEAVGAVDRAVHSRLEGHLRLVAARRADDREVLARRAVVAALVATRPADLADVIAGIPSGASAGPTARAPLRIRGKPLLGVELLVCGGMNEFHPTIDATDRSVDEGHGACSSPARCRGVAGLWCVPGRPIGGRDVRWREKPGPRDPRCRCGVPARGAPVVRGAGYNDLRDMAVCGMRAGNTGRTYRPRGRRRYACSE